MPLSTLGNTCDRTTSGVACYHLPWKANMIRRRQAWHARMALGQHTRSNDVGPGYPSSQLCSIGGRTTSHVACPHGHCPAHPIERCLVWHAILALGQHTQLDKFSNAIITLRLHKRLVIKCHHCRLDNAHGKMKSTWLLIIAF